MCTTMNACKDQENADWVEQVKIQKEKQKKKHITNAIFFLNITILFVLSKCNSLQTVSANQTVLAASFFIHYLNTGNNHME